MIDALLLNFGQHLCHLIYAFSNKTVRICSNVVCPGISSTDVQICTRVARQWSNVDPLFVMGCQKVISMPSNLIFPIYPDLWMLLGGGYRK